MADFQRGDELDLPYGLRLRAEQVSGSVGDVARAPGADAPVRDTEPGTLPEALERSGQPADAAALLGTAAERSGMRRALSVPLDDLAVPPGAATGRTRDVAETPHVALTAPLPPDDEGQVVLEVDDSGLVRWHVAVDTGRAAPGRRAALDQTFLIPVAPLDLTAGPTGSRGPLGLGVRKVLHLIRYPVETLAGRAGEAAVGWWERRHRPYGLDLVTPATATKPLTTPGVTAQRLRELADAPFLLLVHGTFSTGRAAFDGLFADTTLFPDLCARYGGRVLVFDHPTLHVDPDANVAWLLGRLPDDVGLTLDVVCHSRGGLVGRRLAARPGLTVRGLVHVATPNAGTVLASPERWGVLLDVVTNLVSLLPDTATGTVVEAVLEVVKQLGTGVLGGLDGLAAMDPGGRWLTGLDDPVPPGRLDRAVCADYEPATSAVLALRALDLLVDPYFGAANDLVVPTGGVYDGAGGYRVPDPVVLPAARAVAHTRFFHDDQVRATLAGWLTG